LLQETKERFFLEAIKHDCYIEALAHVNAFLGSTLGEQSASPPTPFDARFVDHRKRPVNSDEIGPHHLVVLTGTSALAFDKTPKQRLSYILRTVRGLRAAIKDVLGENFDELPVQGEIGEPVSRDKTRGDKHFLARSPDYYADYVVPFFEGVFLP